MKLKFIILFLAPILSFGQDFTLKEPNVAELKKNNYSDDVAYLYLQRNYKQSSDKTNVKKHEYPDYSICSFEQGFEYGITYSVKQNGVMQAEMDMNLLKKIEELTLYTITQEKKIKELESLNKKFLELQSRLEELESKK